MLFVEVPSYRDTSACHPVKVNFYVINGKRKRSQPQHFTYTPLTCKNAAQPLCGMLKSYALGLERDEINIIIIIVSTLNI